MANASRQAWKGELNDFRPAIERLSRTSRRAAVEGGGVLDRNEARYLYTTVSLGRSVVSVTYSLELKVLEPYPADVCAILQP